ncbi:MAG: tRNA (guanosine(37)-N1)-methyltransferase TrmD [Saprospiraceae bacterium]|nr:tRNA (guanosine(37)-N1)-methyltransferase TrmD [Saprospiraceae bacterium]
MRIDIISAVPDLLHSPFQHSIIKRAAERKLLEINVINLRDFGLGPHQQIDDYQYGGGAGMVMMIEPIYRAIESLKKVRDYDEIIYMTPDGQPLKQALANKLSLSENLLILSGHYKGIDERVREHFVTCEISIGDYVLSGGELPTAVLVDCIGRLIPGVLNDETSALFDSFQDDLLAPAVYTRPADFKGMQVPPILLSGNEAAIEKWREENAMNRTRTRRPDLLEDKSMTD